jgi:hypothetical protein
MVKYEETSITVLHNLITSLVVVQEGVWGGGDAVPSSLGGKVVVAAAVRRLCLQETLVSFKNTKKTKKKRHT